jgi:hypothetical protein
MSMNTRTSIFAGTVFVSSILLTMGACQPKDPFGDEGGFRSSSGSGGSGSGSGGSGCTVTSGSDSDAGQPPTFATVKTVVGFYCGGGGCHDPGDTMPNINGVTSDSTLYTTLTTFTSTMCGNRVLVQPCSPQDSAFYLAQAGMCGSLDKMPKGCSDTTCTDPDYLEGIRQWIANGAPGP